MKTVFHVGVSFALAATGCGDSGGSGGGEGDGRFHPDASGVPISEAEACDGLRGALETKALSLGCIATFRVCPGFVQTETGESCAQYDEGTVTGCVSYYSEATSCEDLTARYEACAFESVPDTAPAGCP